MRMMMAALLLVLIATPASSFFWSPAGSYRVPSDSMQPLLRAGEAVEANRYDDASGGTGSVQPRRGDVAFFTVADNVWIMRITGVGGDHVQMLDGRLHLNGSALPIEPVEPVDGACPSYTSCSFLRETLPDGPSYVVMRTMDDGRGDNTAEIVVPPGRFFVMGDNRDNSNDSRFGDRDYGMIGLIDREAMIGRWDAPDDPR